MLQAPQSRGHVFGLSERQAGTLDFADLVAEQIEPVLALATIGANGGKRTACVLTFRKRGGHAESPGDRLFADPKVEMLPVGERIEEALMVMLPVQVDEQSADLPEGPNRCLSPVDATRRTPFCRYFAVDVQLRFVQRIAEFLASISDLGGGREIGDERHRPPCGTRADELRLRPPPEGEPDRIDEQRLARTGFAGQCRKARTQDQLGALDDRQVLDREFEQHRPKRPPPILRLGA